MVKAVKSVIQTTEAVAQFLIVLDPHVFNRLSDEGTFQKQAFWRSLSQPKSFENGGRGHFVTQILTLQRDVILLFAQFET